MTDTTKSKTALCVVPCGSKKVWQVHPGPKAVEARYVYIGSFAVATRLYAERFFESWVILSAKHGFLRPSDMVDGDYNVSFNGKGEGTITPECLREQVVAKELAGFNEIVVVAGRAYAGRVEDAFEGTKAKILHALHGMRGIGVMQAAMKKARESGMPLR